MKQPKRRHDVTDLAEKVIFLTTHKQPRRRHGLSMAGVSVACGKSISWLKGLKDVSRNTQTMDTEAEAIFAKLYGFDPRSPEWREGSPEVFKQHNLAEKASPTRNQKHPLRSHLISLTSFPNSEIRKARADALTSPPPTSTTSTTSTTTSRLDRRLTNYPS